LFQTSPTSSALLGAQNEIGRLTRLLSAQKALMEDSTRQRQLAETKATSATKHQSTIQREKNELETKFGEIEGRLEGEIKRREEVEGRLRVADMQVGRAWRGAARHGVTWYYGYVAVRVLVQYEYMSGKGLRLTSVLPRCRLYSHVVLDQRRKRSSARPGC
jgi:hypothetical protein